MGRAGTPVGMAQPSSLHRFQLELSDIDRGVYESLDFRIARHPSETVQFLLTRVLAYALNYERDLVIAAGGLSDTDEPALSVPDSRGGLKLCIEIGSPSAKRLHKDMKHAQTVKVYTYKDPQALLREIKANDVYKMDELEVWAFSPRFLDGLEPKLERDNKWMVLRSDGTLTITIGDESFSGEATRHSTKDET